MQETAQVPPADDTTSASATTRVARVALLVVGWAGVLVALGGLVARTVAVPWQPAIIAAATSLYLAFGAVVGGVILAWRRRWIGAVLATAVLAATIVVHVPLYVADTPRAGVPLVVLQANIEVGRVDPDALVEQVRAQRADVLTVDELTPDGLARLTAAGLDQVLSHRFVTPYPGGAGTGIWSRYPLSETTPHDEFSFELLTARVAVPDAVPTHVAAVHLLPPWPYPAATWLAEVDAAREVLRGLGSSSSAVVASGDFNSGLDNPQVRRLLSDGFRDAAEQAGSGFDPTYPTDRFAPPFLVLDHVVVRGADASAVRTAPLAGSDHRGLSVTVQVPRR